MECPGGGGPLKGPQRRIRESAENPGCPGVGVAEDRAVARIPSISLPRVVTRPRVEPPSEPSLWAGPVINPQFKRVSPSPARGAMAHVGSRKRSRSRSRSRGRGSEKKRKKSSKDAPRSCSASRSRSRKASTTSSGAEGENQREWERGEGTSWRKLQAAGRASPDWLWGNRGERYSEAHECRSWISGLKDAQNPGAGPAH